MYNQKVVGFLNARIVLDEISINNIAVASNYNDVGIGKALMLRLFCFSREKDVTLITLEVRQSNEKAIEFYKNQGFELVGERKNFYSNPTESAILMNKKMELEV